MSSARTDPQVFFDLLNDSGPVTQLPRTQIDLSDFNPRRLLGGETAFEEHALLDLTESIRRSGVLQPVLVRPLEHGRYELVAGERRFHAAGLAGLSDIPVLVKELTRSEAAELSILENTQRQALSPDVLGLLAIRSVAALCAVEPDQVLSLATRLKNGDADPFDVAGHLRRLYRMSVSSFAQRYAKAALLNGEERAALLEGRFGLNALLPLASLEDQVTRRDKLHQLLSGECTASELAEAVRATQGKSALASPERQLKSALPRLRQLSGTRLHKAQKLIKALLAVLEE